MSKVGSHPEIHSLIKTRDTIRDLMAQGVYVNAITLMQILIIELKPEDIGSGEGKALLAEINGELGFIREIYQKNPGVVPNHTFNQKDRYLNFYSRLNSILWDRGYLIDETYKFHDPSGGRKSGR